MSELQGNRLAGLIGGSGFIGQALLPRLIESGWTVRIIDIVEPAKLPERSEFQRADVTDRQQMVEALRGCQLVINLAAAHRDDIRPISLYHDVNVNGATNVCDAASEVGIDNIIFTSSVAIYGLQDGVPDETSPAKPFNLYGQSKWEAEGVYRGWQDEANDRRRLLIVRPTVVFGPGNRGNVYNLLRQVASGRFLMIGSGENCKSMAFVKNVAAFLEHMAGRLDASPGTFVYNYCDKPDLNMNVLIATIKEALGGSETTGLRLPYAFGMMIASVFDVAAALTGRTFPISRVRVQKFCANTIFAADKLKETDFTSPCSLKQALLDTIAYEFPRSIVDR